ncbi:threonine dehydratase [Acidobacteria bacterium AH-259-G07]|nr:threonine dehydratase [Acidobacteria bacterium AH-259-G07]
MEVTFQGILEAHKSIYRYLRPTPLIPYPLLDRFLGCRAYVKHENHHPTGSFKIRGGINLISNLSAEEKRRGVITATRGNHGQSIALASKLHGVRCTVSIPHGNNPEKNEAMEAFGAELLVYGRDFDEAREKVEEIQGKEDLRYVHSANEPMLIHGVGTYALEILEDLPRPDYIFVPLGGGSGISGVLTVVRAVAPGVKVVGVQAERAPSVYRSWKEGKIQTTDCCDTMADGLATRVPFELTFSIICRHVDDIVTVSEEELAGAVYHLYRTTHNVAEGAGAAALAAARKFGRQLAGKKVVLILSGSNIEAGLFRRILEEHATDN